MRVCEEVAGELCRRVAGGEVLSEVCKGEGMPRVAEVYAWLEGDEVFARRYARARELQAWFFFEELVGIADGLAGLDVEARGASARVAAEKLRIDVRKFYIARVLPGVFGERASSPAAGDGDEVAEPLRVTPEVEARWREVAEIRAGLSFDYPVRSAEVGDEEGGEV